MEVKEADITLQDSIEKNGTNPESLVEKIRDYTSERCDYTDRLFLLSKCIAAQSILSSPVPDWEVVQYMMLESKITPKQMRMYYAASILSLDLFLKRDKKEIFQENHEAMKKRIRQCFDEKKALLTEDEIEKRVADRLIEERRKREAAEEEKRKEDAYKETIRELECSLSNIRKEKQKLEEQIIEVSELCIRSISERRTWRRKKHYASFQDAMQHANLSKNQNQILLLGHQKGVADEELLSLIEKRIPEENMKAAVALLIANRQLEDERKREREEKEQKEDIDRFGYVTAGNEEE